MITYGTVKNVASKPARGWYDITLGMSKKMLHSIKLFSWYRSKFLHTNIKIKMKLAKKN